ncbi:MAG: ABC transporter transmembrane domain-containing protein, partial [Flavobacteriaceae bacterium]|nr:ABC transporter transmembrane domain-containing protein [Flavobacteriaceae bacterium]
MEYLKKLSRFIYPYRRYGFLNIICNVFYALFSTLAMVSLMPMINILFGEGEKVSTMPKYQGIGDLKPYLEDSMNYFLTTTTEIHGPQRSLLYLIVLIISLFLIKNLFNYLALYFITFLRNGVLKDLRNAIYSKVIYLPISYYSEKKKGDIIARISGDVNEVKNSLLAVLELIVK